jgi:hypothetical protein
MRTRILIAIAATAIGAWALPATASSTATAEDGKTFTACMRANGLPDFPEVTFSTAGSTGGLVNLTLKGGRVDVMSDEYGKAIEACKHLLPDGFTLPVKPEAPKAPVLPF